LKPKKLDQPKLVRKVGETDGRTKDPYQAKGLRP
jgi:hypothetical protein